MRRVVCPRCLACFSEGDATWERACSQKICPYCSRPLDVDDEAVQFDLYKADPDPLLVQWFLIAVGVAFALATAWLLLKLISWPLPTLGLAIIAFLYASRRLRTAYRMHTVIILIGVFGITLGWFTWPVPTLCLVSIVALHLLNDWLGRPLRHRRQKFEDFASFLTPWSESLDRKASIFIEPDAPRTPRLRFRIAGRGANKRLKVRLPRRRPTEEALLRELESLAGLFEGVALRERPRSFEFSLPAQASFSGSVASRAAQAAFTALGCTEGSTFTIFAEGGSDPYHELRVSEQIAESTSGIISRFFEARARHLRSSLPKQGRPRRPAA